MNGKLTIKAYDAPWRMGVELLICGTSADGNIVAVADPVTFRKVDPTTCEPLPTSVTLFRDQAQTLMDELWNCGLRPTEGTGSAGALKATERHLDDMRRLVFKGESNDA